MFEYTSDKNGAILNSMHKQSLCVTASKVGIVVDDSLLLLEKYLSRSVVKPYAIQALHAVTQTKP